MKSVIHQHLVCSCEGQHSYEHCVRHLQAHSGSASGSLASLPRCVHWQNLDQPGVIMGGAENKRACAVKSIHNYPRFSVVSVPLVMCGSFCSLASSWAAQKAPSLMASRW